MGPGTKAGADNTLLDITSRIAHWLALPLVLSDVLSQFSAAIADTAAADGNLRGLNRWVTGPPLPDQRGRGDRTRRDRPTLTNVAVASRAFAAYYDLQAVIAMRTATGPRHETGFGSPPSR